MTIKIYPSRMPGEPLETHQHGSISLEDWMIDNVEGYSASVDHPVAIEVNGQEIPSSDWSLCIVTPQCDIRIYPVPHGVVVVAWVAVALAVASAAYSIIMMSQLSKSGEAQNTGDQLDLSPAKANTAKLGDPIREVLGRYQVFPDYLVQPVSRFDSSNRQIYRTSMFLCVGRGRFAINQSDIKIGNTPISAFGDDIQVTIYQPGATISGDSRSENWYNSTEVGGTSAGTSGLDLASTSPDSISVSADAFAISGKDITLISSASTAEVPPAWTVGTIITAIMPDSFRVTTEAGRNVIYGDFSELSPVVGMAVSMQWESYDYELYISSYNAGSPAVPGVGGSASSLTGSAAPASYDFRVTPTSFTINWNGISYIISLTSNYVTMSGLLNEITDQLTGSGLVATNSNSRVRISEVSSPYSGNAITTGALPSAVFGANPVIVDGTASSGGTPAVDPSIRLAYNSATGSAFSGMPSGLQRIGISLRGYQYRVTQITDETLSVQRMRYSTDGALVVDTTWPGFIGRTVLDGSVTGVNDTYNWMGPFLTCPAGEVSSVIEINFIYPQGLIDIGSKDGKWHWHEVKLSLQYRLSGSSIWTEREISHGDTTVNMIGFTHRINLPSAGNYEVRVRRITPVWGGTTRDSVQWQSMRSLLQSRPDRYDGVTTMGLSVRAGSRLASQADRRINVVATRLYDSGVSRSISGALNAVADSMGLSVNPSVLSSLESAYWTPQGDSFDFSVNESSSSLDVLNMICTAGKSYFLFSEGVASVGREGVKPWSGVVSPNEQVTPLVTAFKAVTRDDFDGVDVTYISSITWAEETVQCRMPGSSGASKIEAFTLNGVTNQNKAYQIGMRRLMKYQRQRINYSTSTNLEALCYSVGDRIILTDDIPDAYQTVSAWIESASTSSGVTTMTISEPIDWSKYPNPRIIVRYQDGTASAALTATRVTDYTLTTPYLSDFSSFDFSSPTVENPKAIFCDLSRAGYDGIVTEIAPNPDGTCDISALEYREDLYQYDNATYPGDVE